MIGIDTSLEVDTQTRTVRNESQLLSGANPKLPLVAAVLAFESLGDLAQCENPNQESRPHLA